MQFSQMNKHKRTLVSSGDIITRTLESKKGLTKEKIPKIEGETKGKSLKLENEQKIFKLEDDKKEIHVKEKFSNNKSTKRSAYEKHENSNSDVPMDKIDKEFREKISEPTEERKLNLDKKTNQTSFCAPKHKVCVYSTWNVCSTLSMQWIYCLVFASIFLCHFHIKISLSLSCFHKIGIQYICKDKKREKKAFLTCFCRFIHPIFFQLVF